MSPSARWVLLYLGVGLEKGGCLKAFPTRKETPPKGQSSRFAHRSANNWDTNTAPTPHSSIPLMKGLSLAVPPLPGATQQNKPFSTPISGFGEKTGTIPTSWGHPERHLHSRALGGCSRVPQTQQPWQYYKITTAQQSVIY